MFYTSVLVDLRKEVGSVKQKRFPPNIFKSSTEKVREILHFYFYNVFLVSGSVGFVGSKTFWLPLDHLDTDLQKYIQGGKYQPKTVNKKEIMKKSAKKRKKNYLKNLFC